jgi:cell division transport system permease protein
MSGSFDKPPTAWPAAPAARGGVRVEAYQGQHTQQAPPLAPRTVPTARGDGGGEGRTRRQRGGGLTLAPVVPAGSVTGRSLTLVITIMCFLASLTAGAVYMMNQSASDWLRGMASEVTALIEPKQRSAQEVEKLVAEVTGFLSRQPGVSRARALTAAEMQELLAPWFGESASLGSLPVPRLISVELDRGTPSDLAVLRKALAATFRDAGVRIDDHQRWQAQIKTITRSFALGGFAILLLVGAATTAIIVSATKSAMASNRDIVEVLHFVGATDRFIAREFERHFLRLGVRAGVVGALWAVLVFLSMPTVMELLGGGAVTIAELRRLIGVATLDIPGYILLGIVVLVIAALCMLTSRIGVYRILNSQH